MASLFVEYGAGKESRTLDLNLGKVALYQLSYSRVLRLRSVTQIAALFGKERCSRPRDRMAALVLSALRVPIHTASARALQVWQTFPSA
jgi:hypothetical protein